MDVEKTMQFLIGTAAQHDERMAEIEKNNVLIQQAVLGLTEHQGVLQTGLDQTQKLLHETQVELRKLGEGTDRRIAGLVSAIARIVENRPNA